MASALLTVSVTATVIDAHGRLPYPSHSDSCGHRMGGAFPSERPSPYRRETDATSHFGTRATCELCGHTRRCFDEHGFVACEDCHTELLPGDGILSPL